MNPHSHAIQMTGSRLASIAASTEAASISLLAAIDGTVSTMQGIASVMSGFAKVIARNSGDIRAEPVQIDEYVDESGVTVDALEGAASALKDFLARLVVTRAAIDKDARLKDHHSEALHDAYEAAITEVGELIEVILDSRAAIITHDLAAEPRDGPAFDSVEALIADLRKR